MHYCIWPQQNTHLQPAIFSKLVQVQNSHRVLNTHDKNMDVIAQSVMTVLSVPTEAQS